MTYLINKTPEAAHFLNLAVLNIESIYVELSGARGTGIGNIMDDFNKVSGDKNKRINLENLAKYLWMYKCKELPEESKDVLIILEKLLNKLNDIRNYLSHYDHEDTPLDFKNEEDYLRKFLLQLFSKAKQALEYDSEIELFNNNKLSADGLMFFSSLFLYKSQMNHFLSKTPGYKRTDPDYIAKRKLTSFFSAKDSHRELTIENKNFKNCFDIILYLNRIPEISFNFNKEVLKKNIKSKDDKEIEVRRKDMFAKYALAFIDDFKLLPSVKFKVFDHKTEKGWKYDKGEKNDYNYVIRNNNVFFILDNQPNPIEIALSIHELKNLVYILIDKVDKKVEGKKNVDELLGQFFNRYFNILNEQILKGKTENIDYGDILWEKCFPVSIRNIISKKEITNDELRDEIKKRLENINIRLETLKNNNETSAHEKIKEVLRFINESLPQEKKLKQYLQKDNKTQTTQHISEYTDYFEKVRFYSSKKDELVHRLESDKRITDEIKGLLEAENLEGLFEKAIQGLIKKYSKSIDELQKYYSGDLKEIARKIGINVHGKIEDKEYIEKIVKTALNQIAIPRGFIRNYYFPKDRKSSVKPISKIYISQRIADIKKDEDDEINAKLNDFYCEVDRAYKKYSLSKLTKLSDIKAKDRLLLIIAKRYYKEAKPNGNLFNQSLTVKEIFGKEHKIVVKDKNNNKYILTFDNKSYFDFNLLLTHKNVVNVLYKHFDGMKEVAASSIREKIDGYFQDALDYINDVFKLERKLIDRIASDEKYYTLYDGLLKENKNEGDFDYINFNDLLKKLNKSLINDSDIDALYKLRNNALHNEIPDGMYYTRGSEKIKELIVEIKNKDTSEIFSNSV